MRFPLGFTFEPNGDFDCRLGFLLLSTGKPFFFFFLRDRFETIDSLTGKLYRIFGILSNYISFPWKPIKFCNYEILPKKFVEHVKLGRRAGGGEGWRWQSKAVVKNFGFEMS